MDALASLSERPFISVGIWGLEEPHRVTGSQPASHLRRKLFDERKVVAIETVAKIERTERKNVRVMLTGDDIRPTEIEDAVTCGARFEWKQPILVLREYRRRSNRQTFVAKLQPDPSS
jgi:hypothetical protein